MTQDIRITTLELNVIIALFYDPYAKCIQIPTFCVENIGRVKAPYLPHLRSLCEKKLVTVTPFPSKNGSAARTTTIIRSSLPKALEARITGILKGMSIAEIINVRFEVVNMENDELDVA